MPSPRWFRLFTFAISTTLAASGLLLGVSAAAHAGISEVVMSQGKPIVASSQYSTAWRPAYANDGVSATRWSGAWGNSPQWIRIDLGAVKKITHVRLNWERGYATSYKIQISNNGTTWQSIYGTARGNGGVDELYGLSGTARYVRMYATGKNTPWGYSLYEFRVYGPGSAPAPSVASPLRFSDEFNGVPGLPDVSRWTNQTGGAWGNGREAQYYTPRDRGGRPNAYRDGAGNMVIEARREGYGSNAYTSARLASNYTQRYGRLEIRARIDSMQPGVWPALWTVGSSGPNETAWPTTGEIDMMEWFGGGTPNVIGHLHSNPDYNRGFTAAGSDVRNWNLYTVEWRPGFLEFKLNGVRYGYHTSSSYGPGWSSFSYAQGIRMNIAINTGGNTWMPRVSSSFAAARMYVDYVRLYA